MTKRKPETGKNPKIASWRKQSIALLVFLLLLSNFTPFVAQPTYAAQEKPTKSVISAFQKTVSDFCDRLLPNRTSPTISPVPLPQNVLGEETNPITPKAQALDLEDLELRIASLENQLISNSQSSVSSSFTTTSTLDTTASNLIRNSSYESANVKDPRTVESATPPTVTPTSVPSISQPPDTPSPTASPMPDDTTPTPAIIPDTVSPSSSPSPSDELQNSPLPSSESASHSEISGTPTSVVEE